MGDVDQDPLGIARLDDLLAKGAQALVGRGHCLEVPDRSADVMDELQMTETLLVGGIQPVEAALQEIGTFGCQNDARLTPEASVDIGGCQDHAQALVGRVGLHAIQHAGEALGDITWGGLARLFDSRARDAKPRPVRNIRPGHDGHALRAHVLGKAGVRDAPGDQSVVAVHVGDGNPGLPESRAGPGGQ